MVALAMRSEAHLDVEEVRYCSAHPDCLFVSGEGNCTKACEGLRRELEIVLRRV